MNKFPEVDLMSLVAGLVLGLFIALWWRAAQLREHSGEVSPIVTTLSSPGMSPDHINP